MGGASELFEVHFSDTATSMSCQRLNPTQTTQNASPKPSKAGHVIAKHKMFQRIIRRCCCFSLKASRNNQCESTPCRNLLPEGTWGPLRLCPTGAFARPLMTIRLARRDDVGAAKQNKPCLPSKMWVPAFGPARL